MINPNAYVLYKTTNLLLCNTRSLCVMDKISKRKKTNTTEMNIFVLKILSEDNEKTQFLSENSSVGTVNTARQFPVSSPGHDTFRKKNLRRFAQGKSKRAVRKHSLAQVQPEVQRSFAFGKWKSSSFPTASNNGPSMLEKSPPRKAKQTKRKYTLENWK